MKKNKKIYFGIALLFTISLIVFGCQKMTRPPLSDFPQDIPVVITGPLRFFVPFEGTDPVSRFNMADDISKNPAFTTTLKTGPGINGNGLNGADGAAVKYINANDIKSATSLTIAFWVKRDLNSRTEFYFGLTADAKDYWPESSLFMLVEHGTATAATVKLYMNDNWYEFPDGSQFPKPLLDGKWHHLAMAYDETTSKMTWYFDGGVVTAPASATSQGGQTGPLKLKSAGNMIIGGWNKNAGVSGLQDSWISSFAGNMDQFRMYNKALSASEVLALYNSKL
jgi:hypothetical protein